MGNVSSQSIILNFTKYSETSIIVNCYSLLNGYSSHIVKGVRSKKKSRFKLGHFQRLNLVEIENGNIENVKAPQIAIDYWGLSQFAKLKDVIIAVRNDEMGHRDVNHEFVTLIDQKDPKETYTDSREILSKDNTK